MYKAIRGDEAEEAMVCLSELLDEHGEVRAAWLDKSAWVVVPVWGSYDNVPGLAQRAASAATKGGAKSFVSFLPPGAKRYIAKTGERLPAMYRSPCTETGWREAYAEWISNQEHAITTDNRLFVVANPPEHLFFLAGPRTVVEELLASTLAAAWLRFEAGFAEGYEDEDGEARVREALLKYQPWDGRGPNPSG